MSDDATKTVAEKKDTRPHLAPYRWQPGQRPEGAGRPKGSRNKLGEAFIAAMHDDFKEHGVSVIERVRNEKPDAYLKVIASILPKELNVNTNALGEMSDDELIGVISALRAIADTVNSTLAGEGSSAEEGGKQAPPLPTIQ